ncbi:MAG: hypothetical protein Q9168_003936, partial [Polycauliona sp. 1 TL-2023]
MAVSPNNPPPSKSTHFTDPLLQPFLAPTFTATTYLNSTLPSPPSKTQQLSAPQPTLSTLASQTQSHISILSAQTSRLSATLTALTDDILRSSSRLTYEIEILRGEANGLVESLGNRGGLNNAIKTFVPEGLDKLAIGDSNSDRRDDGKAADGELVDAEEKDGAEAVAQPFSELQATAINPQNRNDTPISPLRTLLLVRSSLTTIKSTFALALSWPMPPSLLPSTSSSLISISSPSSQSSTASLESAGQNALREIRGEIE